MPPAKPVESHSGAAGNHYRGALSQLYSVCAKIETPKGENVGRDVPSSGVEPRPPKRRGVRENFPLFPASRHQPPTPMQFQIQKPISASRDCGRVGALNGAVQLSLKNTHDVT